MQLRIKYNNSIKIKSYKNEINTIKIVTFMYEN